MNGNKPTRIILAATLTLASTLAFAQYNPQYGPPPQGQWDDAHWGNGPQGYGEYYQEQGRPNFGARRGYATGYEMGVSDRRTGHSYRPTHLDEFKHVPDPPPGISHDEFKHFYREAFLRGYQRGYGH
ncbi:MAG TPA: hypothetical protein VGD62_00670 [Acidobacteriaceae bacterium]